MQLRQGDERYSVLCETGNQGIIYKLGGMVQSMQNLDYLPPAASPMDIQTAKYEEWKWLFQEIRRTAVMKC